MLSRKEVEVQPFVMLQNGVTKVIAVVRAVAPGVDCVSPLHQSKYRHRSSLPAPCASRSDASLLPPLGQGFICRIYWSPGPTRVQVLRLELKAALAITSKLRFPSTLDIPLAPVVRLSSPAQRRLTHKPRLAQLLDRSARNSGSFRALTPCPCPRYHRERSVCAASSKENLQVSRGSSEVLCRQEEACRRPQDIRVRRCLSRLYSVSSVVYTYL